MNARNLRRASAFRLEDFAKAFVTDRSCDVCGKKISGRSAFTGNNKACDECWEWFLDCEFDSDPEPPGIPLAT